MVRIHFVNQVVVSLTDINPRDYSYIEVAEIEVDTPNQAWNIVQNIDTSWVEEYADVIHLTKVGEIMASNGSEERSLRSMMIGDIVEVVDSGEHYLCDFLGWRKLEKNEVPWL